MITPQESTPYSDLTTTFSLTYKTDLTTTAIQQPSLANDRGTKYDLTSISPQTTETWSEIKTQVNEDETSYTFDWTQFDTSISEAASTMQDISLSAIRSINLITTDKDIVPFNKPDSVTKETHTENSDTVANVLTSDSTLLTTVDFIDDSMVLNATLDSTGVNNTQPGESSDGHKDGDSHLIFSQFDVVLRQIYRCCCIFLEALWKDTFKQYSLHSVADLDNSKVSVKSLEPLSQSNFFFIFMHLWLTFMPNNRLAQPPPLELAHLWEILDPPLVLLIFVVYKLAQFRPTMKSSIK